MPLNGELWEKRDRVRAAWDRYVARCAPAPGTVRTEVLASWQRSATHVRPDAPEAPVDDLDRTAEQWRHSPLYGPVQELLPELSRLATDDFVVAVTDPDGKILFAHGGHHMRDRAATVNFVVGGRWDEASVGTNALDLALRTGTAQTVFSAEHFSLAVHDWVCYSAPVRDASGRPLGVIDLSTTWDLAHPLAMTTAATLARYLQQQVDVNADVRGTLLLRTLGSDPAVRVDGRPVRVSPRHLELLTVLSLHPEGRDLEQLHADVYPDHAAATNSCKAEVSHLRRQLDGVIGSRPYRFTCRVAADHLEVERLLEAGLVGAAAAGYRGPLLPRSESPAIVAHRDFLHVALRTAVLRSADPAAAVAFGRVDPDDTEVHRHALRLLPDGDPRRNLVRARLA
ncbi:transcriptional regulator [Egicoccus sp. AB-alg2]|uniref:transcriptional regulator n=1 Tax=Egicoccus sp. AB-alg2 TaxID=3242693 RepID=UPI00359F04C6